MDIWHVHNNEATCLRLWRTTRDSFMVIEAGTYAPVLTNHSYTLIDKKYASLFAALDNQISIQPVRINDLVKKSENHSYVELIGANSIDTETIFSLDSSGRKMWTYQGYLFVTGELRRELFHAGQQELEFNLGFSMFV